MRRTLLALGLLAITLATGALLLLRAESSSAEVFAGLQGDPTRGASVFDAAGCASCHAAPGATGDARFILSGGRQFPSDFGTFSAPNISPDPEQGIGAWSALDLYNAMHHGTAPDGRHYYPAFPYAAYRKAEPQDILDLYSFLITLPPSASPSAGHDIGFPFSIRAGIGAWKALYLSDDWAVAGDLPPEAARGRYLVEALGHCGECHTPRGALGGLKTGAWLSGAPAPSGRGRVPNITPARLGWSAGEIETYLATGFTPDFDSAGGHMADVIDNLSRLAPTERRAIAAYLKLVLPVPDATAR